MTRTIRLRRMPCPNAARVERAHAVNTREENPGVVYFGELSMLLAVILALMLLGPRVMLALVDDNRSSTDDHRALAAISLLCLKGLLQLPLLLSLRTPTETKAQLPDTCTPQHKTITTTRFQTHLRHQAPVHPSARRRLRPDRRAIMRAKPDWTTMWLLFISLLLASSVFAVHHFPQAAHGYVNGLAEVNHIDLQSNNNGGCQAHENRLQVAWNELQIMMNVASIALSQISDAEQEPTAAGPFREHNEWCRKTQPFRAL